MLMGSNYPQFTCPNCRAITDLEAELEAEDGEEWEQAVDEPTTKPVENLVSHTTQPTSPFPDQQDTVHAGGAAAAYDEVGDIDLTNIQFEASGDQTTNTTTTTITTTTTTTPQLSTSGLLSRRQTSTNTTTTPSQGAAVNGIEIPGSSTAGQLSNIVTNEAAGTLRAATPTSADVIGGEGPLTPRNDAGPFVFDGSAGRASARHLSANAMDESD